MHNATTLREDEKKMREAVALARMGTPHPNPAVGAVVAQNGRVIARGWHRAAGAPHAEIEALGALKNPARARGATLYVTLEPCSTQGRTPPCTRAIIAAGIARVVYGAGDPNPAHAGRADAILKAAGIAVTPGVLAEECSAINTAWNKWIATGLPFVIAKCGMSLDGRITSPPGRRWITSREARDDAMELRAGAILVGAETIRSDNPRLTVRGRPGAPQPWRIVWSRSGNIPASSHVLTDRHRHRTLVFKKKSLRDVLKDLARRGIHQVLIEGGGRTLGEAFDRGLVDRMVFYIAPILTGGPVPAVAGRGRGSNQEAIALDHVTCRLVGGNLRIQGDVFNTNSRPAVGMRLG